MKQEVIEFSKPKILLLLRNSAIFFAAGLLMLSIKAHSISINNIFSTVDLEHFFGIILLFFAFLVVIIFIKLHFSSAKSHGILFYKDGFEYKSGFSKINIPWHDIERIGQHKIGHREFISIYLKNPEEFIKAHSIIMCKTRDFI